MIEDTDKAPESPKYTYNSGRFDKVSGGKLFNALEDKAMRERRSAHDLEVTNWIHAQDPGEKFTRLSET